MPVVSGKENAFNLSHNTTVTFSITRLSSVVNHRQESSGFWLEFSSPSGLRTTGPFQFRFEALKYGHARGWTFVGNG